MCKLGAQCQSCSMPLSKDPARGGTNTDGSKSSEYCGYCYVNGQFSQPGPVEDYRRNLDQMMKDKKHPWWIRMIAWYQIPTLKRWKK